MKEFFNTPIQERKLIIENIKKTLQQREEFVFAYLFGSFLDGVVFRDIDVGIYLDPQYFKKQDTSYKYTFKIADAIEKEIKEAFPVDVRILNKVPFQFLNSVFQGKLLFSRDDDFLGDLIEKTAIRYLRYRPIAEKYLRERLKS